MSCSSRTSRTHATFSLTVLERSGATVSAAENARVALSLLDGERFDIIVSDIGLPEMDGLAMMRHVRSRRSERGGTTLAVALTAYTRAFDRTSALRAGYQAHVPKPRGSARARHRRRESRGAFVPAAAGTLALKGSSAPASGVVVSHDMIVLSRCESFGTWLLNRK